MYKILFAVIFIFSSCKRKAEFVVNGKQYYTEKRCIESYIHTEWEYHIGYNLFNGKWEPHYGPVTYKECINSIIDTIEIK